MAQEEPWFGLFRGKQVSKQSVRACGRAGGAVLEKMHSINRAACPRYCWLSIHPSLDTAPANKQVVRTYIDYMHTYIQRYSRPCTYHARRPVPSLALAPHIAVLRLLAPALASGHGT